LPKSKDCNGINAKEVAPKKGVTLSLQQIAEVLQKAGEFISHPLFPRPLDNFPRQLTKQQKLKNSSAFSSCRRATSISIQTY